MGPDDSMQSLSHPDRHNDHHSEIAKPEVIVLGECFDGQSGQSDLRLSMHIRLLDNERTFQNRELTFVSSISLVSPIE